MAGAGMKLEPQFETLEQQHASSSLGMWVFLATEVMFFGGLFTAYTIYRGLYPEAFHAASRRLDIVLGTANTSILISSSLTMALAVRCAQIGSRCRQIVFLSLTVLLGLAFLAVKGHEYASKFEERLVPGAAFVFELPCRREAQLFFLLYFFMTGLHALHMIAGIGALGVLIALTARSSSTREHFAAVEISGLYWHFVDIIWIFLFPLLYLVGRN